MIYPPHRVAMKPEQALLFLAGSIEMGKAQQWQEDLGTTLEQMFPHVVVANPRRQDWNSEWAQSLHNPFFVEQVDWELDHLEQADYVVFYFDLATQSPITLLELGKVLETKEPGRVFVCCPQGFWRKGNVDIACQRKRVPVYETMEELTQALRHGVDVPCVVE